MKALKNDSTIYTEQIISAVTECYSKNSETSNSELMKLYALIGENICEQGEKAFVVHLAQTLTEQLPQIKGFSPRNLRRMRDFYRTYESSSSLMENAQALSWTQNTVILECCETNEQRSFYISLATDQSLSKLALMKAIEADTFKMGSSKQTDPADLSNTCPTVGDDTTEEAADTTPTVKTACVAFVTACEPLRQGDGAPIRSDSVKSGKHKQKRSLLTAFKKSLTLPIDWRDYLKRHLKHIWQINCRWANESAHPRWRCNFERAKQGIAFA